MAHVRIVALLFVHVKWEYGGTESEQRQPIRGEPFDRLRANGHTSSLNSYREARTQWRRS